MSIDQTTKETVFNTEQTQLAAEITDLVRDNLPRENAVLMQQMAQTAKDAKAGLAPTSGEGRGQACLSIPPIAYMRWAHEYPGCWKDEKFVEEFAFDNPQCCLPGYKPRPKRLFFDMKHGNRKLRNFGGDFYHEKKAKVNALIVAQTKNG